MAGKLIPENSKLKARAKALLDFGRQMDSQPGLNIFAPRKKKNSGPSFKSAPRKG